MLKIGYGEQEIVAFVDILRAMNGEDSYGRGGVCHPLASVGSWAECLTSAAHVSTGVTFGLSAHRSLRRREVYDECNNQGKPHILGLNTEALRPKKGKVIYGRQDIGMGIAFTIVGLHVQKLREDWFAE
jgi:hypothetical protein